MYVLSYATEVNPAGALPSLIIEDVWRGLEMKAVNALPFVPGMTRCEVIERSDTTILREVTFAGDSHKEFITLRKPVQVQFDRVGEGGFIQNTISESAQGLWLTFTFGLNFPGIEAGSEAERAKGESMRHAYVGAVGATLAKVREMVDAGQI